VETPETNGDKMTQSLTSEQIKLGKAQSIFSSREIKVSLTLKFSPILHEKLNNI
jgi:hypothetical protein